MSDESRSAASKALQEPLLGGDAQRCCDVRADDGDAAASRRSSLLAAQLSPLSTRLASALAGRFPAKSESPSIDLGSPLGFLPKDIPPGELQAYRADYQRFRGGSGRGSRGEIGWLPRSQPSRAGQTQTPAISGEARIPYGEKPGPRPLEAPGSARLPAPPPSFKATRPRKTKEVIRNQRTSWERQVSNMSTPGHCSHAGSGRTATTRAGSQWAPEDDQDFLEDEDSKHILAKVAAVIYQHYEEGEGRVTSGSPSDDEFHEAHFVRRRRGCCCCWPRRAQKQVASKEMVMKLIDDIAHSLFFCKQVVVLSLVYIERFLEITRACLTAGNWRSLVIAAILVASKVGEDVHPWNADFEECLVDIADIWYQPSALYRLESLFLQRLNWRVFVTGETYAAYYFALLEDRELPPDPPSHLGRTGRVCRSYSDPDRTEARGSLFETIDEEEEDGEVAFWTSGGAVGSTPSAENGHKAGNGFSASSSGFLPGNGFGDVNSRSFGEATCGSMSRGGSCSSLSGAGAPPALRSMQAEWFSRSPSVKTPDGSQQGTPPGSPRSRTGERLPRQDAVLTARHIQEAWRLDASNPHIGVLRHAPRALAPSKKIAQSNAKLWAHELALRTSDQMLQGRSKDQGTITLSGATGTQLASELQRYLGKGGTGKPEKEAGEAEPPAGEAEFKAQAPGAQASAAAPGGPPAAAGSLWGLSTNLPGSKKRDPLRGMEGSQF